MRANPVLDLAECRLNVQRSVRAGWLTKEHTDVVIGYPTTDRTALRRLAADERAASRITLMNDSIG